RRLLDAIVNFLPSPMDRKVLIGHYPNDPDREIPCPSDSKAPFVALAFKITSDVHGDLTFIRIYSGTLTTSSRILNSTRDKRENVNKIFRMHAADRTILKEAMVGDIVALIGLKKTLTGDTLCSTKSPVVLESITFPEPVISFSIEPKTSQDRPKLSEAMDILKREDPTFHSRFDHETGQTIISGMGELHLEIIQHKLVRDMNVNVSIGKPRVAYKETITTSATGEAKFVKQTGGRGQYGHAEISIEPHQPTEDEESIVVENRVVGGSIPREYIPAVGKGIQSAAKTGVLAGFPMKNIKVSILDGSYHPVDSSEMAFQQAGFLAFVDAAKKAKPVFLEPIMKIQVVTPDEFYGMVQADLSRKRAVIHGTDHRGRVRIIEATAPLAEMFGYATTLRSITQGRASYSMEPSEYVIMPEQIAKKVLSVYA
ncbi:MAG: elongation factor G, partial [Planctomycetes bacterium]|nr:elongation factor G [Planctomycetota bacterium]